MARAGAVSASRWSDELLVAMSIILILTAIAIPNLIRAKGAANETSACATLHTIVNSANIYSQMCPAQGFPSSLTVMGTGPGDCTGANILDTTLGVASPVKSGYKFIYAAGNVVNLVTYGWTTTADPVSSGLSGQRHFFVDQSGVIRANATAAATVVDPAIQ